MTPKSFLFVNRKAPQGSAHAAEMLDAALIAASFDQHVHLAFLDDGVFQLVGGQRPELLGQRDLGTAFSELGEYDIDHIWVERDSLSERGLSEADLTIPVTLVDRAALAALMARIDVVISA
ncbi:sulfurtransferase complex subunit TusC [Telmatospirillum siberiense]|uniref:Sulfurtransferase complex subunit TusC n=1 Tax=Telmatospirillum siberiense TaxID=382514 RepID=A0A2N3PPE1_9PROT|nr:sulfurtransferase complex subunit TusC [Telmatospirillum siberiense]PKU22246.1 sulfurtransferase complex subunit TusC [Telmatospirillum siberiense]